jgi:hypothetical protein
MKFSQFVRDNVIFLLLFRLFFCYILYHLIVRFICIDSVSDLKFCNRNLKATNIYIYIYIYITQYFGNRCVHF